MLYVPYRSSPLAVQDVLSGRVDLFIADQAVILPQAQAGTLRILAVTSAERSAAVPDVPTVREAAQPARLRGDRLVRPVRPGRHPGGPRREAQRRRGRRPRHRGGAPRLGTFGMNIRCLDPGRGRRLRPRRDGEVDQRDPPGRHRAGIARGRPLAVEWAGMASKPTGAGEQPADIADPHLRAGAVRARRHREGAGERTGGAGGLGRRLSARRRIAGALRTQARRRPSRRCRPSSKAPPA